MVFSLTLALRLQLWIWREDSPEEHSVAAPQDHEEEDQDEERHVKHARHGGNVLGHFSQILRFDLKFSINVTTFSS